jgi:ceramide glucosyltransferase
VPPDYLSEIAAHLEDPAVGLVTHLIAGAGERRLGSLMENLHLAGSIAPAIAAAKRLAGRDVVMGKSMALRRRDLEALGGFESVMDVLAEDYLLGLRVGSVLGKRVALAHRPVENVTQGRGVGGFLSRCRRWSVLQRRLVGPWLYACGALANPVFLLALAAALAPGPGSLAALLAGSGAKVLLDAAAARELRPGGFSRRQLLWVPVKDLLVGFAWAAAFFEDRVRWRGRWLRVLPGTRLEPPAG